MPTAYFDHAATSPIRPIAKAAMIDALDVVGNPAALHRAGQRAKARLEEAREELARAVGCEATEVVFTSGGSEADTLGVLGAWTHSRQPRALVSAIEHPAVLGATSHGAQTIDVAGYGHILSNNVSWTFTDTKNGGHLINYDAAKGKLSNNSFAPEDTSIEVTEKMFVSTEPSQLFIKHLPDGRLPQTDFLRGKKGGILEERKMGWAW